MNPWVKRSLAALAGVVALGALALALGVWMGERKTQRHVEVKVLPVALPADPAGIERGRYLFATRGCAECHGANGAGRAFIDDGHGMYAKAPNISPGAGSVVAAYSAEDWVRTIRHGVKPDGRPVFIMPSEDYNRITDVDLGAIIAYVKQMPPAAGEALVARIPAPVKALYGFGLIKDAAEKIDHTLAPSQPVPAEVSVAHGAYVANMCIGCHGARFSGGKIPGGPPDWPAAANLTPGDGSAMARYADAGQFQAMLKSGRRPDGSAISRVMPFDSLSQLSEVDAQALFMHLKRLAPVAAGNR